MMDGVLTFLFLLKQKKRGKGSDGRNKENVVDDEQEVKEDTVEQKPEVIPEKKLCYEVKHSDVMGRYVYLHL